MQPLLRYRGADPPEEAQVLVHVVHLHERGCQQLADVQQMVDVCSRVVLTRKAPASGRLDTFPDRRYLCDSGPKS